MRDNVSIYQARHGDVEELAGLFDEYRVFYEQPSRIEAARAFVRERLTRGESVVFIARGAVDGQLQALGFTQLYPSFSSVSMKRLWILNDLYVARHARRRGVARALMERARQLAVDTDAKGLVLETAVDNRAAKTLYESCGWKRDEGFDRYAIDV